MDKYNPRVTEQEEPGYRDAVARQLAELAGVDLKDAETFVSAGLAGHGKGPVEGKIYTVGRIPSSPVWL